MFKLHQTPNSDISGRWTVTSPTRTNKLPARNPPQSPPSAFACSQYTSASLQSMPEQDTRLVCKTLQTPFRTECPPLATKPNCIKSCIRKRPSWQLNRIYHSLVNLQHLAWLREDYKQDRKYSFFTFMVKYHIYIKIEGIYPLTSTTSNPSYALMPTNEPTTPLTSSACRVHCFLKVCWSGWTLFDSEQFPSVT